MLTQHLPTEAPILDNYSWSPPLLIKEGARCQVAPRDGSEGYNSSHFRIVTNASLIASKFENLKCRGDHFHTTRDGAEWNPQISEKLALGISQLVVDRKRVVAEASDVVPIEQIHRSFLANPGRAMSDMFKRHVFACHGCTNGHGKLIRTHNRTANECKFHEIPETRWEPEWTCPGCSWKGTNGKIYPKPRGHYCMLMTARAECPRHSQETIRGIREKLTSQPQAAHQATHQRETSQKSK